MRRQKHMVRSYMFAIHKAKLELCAALTGVRLLQAVLYALRHTTTKPEIFA